MKGHEIMRKLMRCQKCGIDSKCFRLWDGNNYCYSCLKRISDKIFRYRKKFHTLFSTIKRNTLVLENTSGIHTWLAFIVTVIVALGTFPDLAMQGYSIAIIFIVFTTVFTILYLLSFAYDLISAIIESTYPPLVFIKNGMLTIRHFQHNAKRITVTAPVTSFKIIRKKRGKCRPSNFWQLFFQKSKSKPNESILLDVTSIVSQLDVNLLKYIFIDEIDGNLHYWLDCHVDSSLLDIWEEFFSVVVAVVQPVSSE